MTPAPPNNPTPPAPHEPARGPADLSPGHDSTPLPMDDLETPEDSRLHEDRLASLAVDRGLMQADELALCLDIRKQRGEPLAQVMLDQGCIAPRQLERLRGDIEAERLGQRIPGFALLGKIGSGSSATVLKARQLNLDRLVAIKVLPRGSARDARLVERFKAEARAAAKLNHPNIVQVFDVGQSGEALFIVMELVPGETVHDLIQERRRLPEGEALDIAIAMGEALAHAHAKGLVHRDVKPKNIIMASGNTPKLADLGLAREIADREAGLAERGQTYGTPYYISPEQVRGDVEIGPPADIYALGATLYLMLTGHVPFTGSRAQDVMDMHVNTPVTPPREVCEAVSEGLSEVVTQMMAKSPDDRYADCGALLTELRAWKAVQVLKAGERASGETGA